MKENKEENNLYTTLKVSKISVVYIYTQLNSFTLSSKLLACLFCRFKGKKEA
jgi:hypothetical protein